MTTFLLILLALSILAMFALQLYLLRKVRRVDLHVWEMAQRLPREVSECFRQLESLQSLYWDLRPERALPPTRGWAGSPDFLREVAGHLFAARPTVVVECSSGASTVVAARCLQILGGGHVYSLEHAPEYASATRRLLASHGLSAWATVIDAPLVATTTDAGSQPWYDLANLPAGPIDVLVIDGPPADTAPLARYPAGPLLFPRLREGGAVFLDDADRPDEQEIVARWQRSFPGLDLRRRPSEKGLAVFRRGDGN